MFVNSNLIVENLKILKICKTIVADFGENWSVLKMVVCHSFQQLWARRNFELFIRSRNSSKILLFQAEITGRRIQVTKIFLNTPPAYEWISKENMCRDFCFQGSVWCWIDFRGKANSEKWTVGKMNQTVKFLDLETNQPKCAWTISPRWKTNYLVD